MRGICVEKLMSREVSCVEPETKLKEVIKRMRENTFSFLVVTNKKIPVGIITEKDIVCILDDLLEKPEISQFPISAFMSSPPVVLNADTTLIEAFEASQRMQASYLPIVDNSGEITGLVTQSDLSRAHFQMVEKQRMAVENTIAVRTQELLKTNEHFRLLALEDALLCIGNRRAMEIDLGCIHETAKRYDRTYSAVLFDIDHFKEYNDEYGHLAGDKLFIRIAGYLKQSIRQPDRIYRYGGDEFLVVLPETPIEDVPIMAQRLVTGLADLNLPHTKTPIGVVTISGGIGSGLSEKNEKPSWRNVLEEADRGLYRAKGNGRNQIAFDCSTVQSSFAAEG